MTKIRKGMFCLLLICIFTFAGVEISKSLSPMPAKQWIKENLKDIEVHDVDQFSFAIFSNNKSSGAVFENLLKLIDHDPDMAFAVSLGDMVSRGEKGRYNYFLSEKERFLYVPLLTIPGENDLRGKGRVLYREIFGPSYYSFSLGKVLFLFLNNAGRQSLDSKQMEWIENELSKTQEYDTRLVFMHVPLYDPRNNEEDNLLSRPYADHLLNTFLKYRVSHIFASLTPGYYHGEWRGIPYTITGGAGGGLSGNDPTHDFFHFLKVNIKGGSFDVEVMPVPGPKGRWMTGYGGWLSVSSFLRFHGIEIFLLVMAGLLLSLVYRLDNRNMKKGG